MSWQKKPIIISSKILLKWTKMRRKQFTPVASIQFVVLRVVWPQRLTLTSNATGIRTPHMDANVLSTRGQGPSVKSKG